MLAVMLAFVAAGAQQANPPELAGDWEKVEGHIPGLEYGLILRPNDETYWKVQGDSIVIKNNGRTDSYKYKLSGKKLTLTNTWGTITFENKTEEHAKKLIGNWIRVKGKAADAKFELLDGGTGTSGGTSITWKAEIGRELVLVKKINGKETAVGYFYSVYNNPESLIKYDTLNLTDSKEKESEYMRKEDMDEIARIKKEAKQSISFTDSRDKKKYKAVKIDGKTWMAENLNFKTDSSFCFGKKDANCAKYGRLYTWDDAKKACPEGWHLSKKEEWDALLKAGQKLGFDLHGDKAGDFLRAKTGWSAFKGGKNGTNELGFSALPGGYTLGGDFVGQASGADITGAWWMDLDKGADAGSAVISTMLEAAGMYSKARLSPLPPRTDEKYHKSEGLSVRCVQD